MNINKKMTPKQFKAILEKLLAVYAKDVLDKTYSDPHFEHVDVDGDRFKVGYMPASGGDSKLMDIKIVYKGKA